jgi:hypothetical protein
VIHCLPSGEGQISQHFWFKGAPHRVLSGIVHVIKNGDDERIARLKYGPKKMIYNRFVR